MRSKLSQICKGISMLLAIAALAMATAQLAAAGDDRERGRQDSGPGCAPHPPAKPPPAGGLGERIKDENVEWKEHARPIPCVSSTGLRTGEPSIAVTNEGAIL